MFGWKLASGFIHRVLCNWPMCYMLVPSLPQTCLPQSTRPREGHLNSMSQHMVWTSHQPEVAEPDPSKAWLCNDAELQPSSTESRKKHQGTAKGIFHRELLPVGLFLQQSSKATVMPASAGFSGAMVRQKAVQLLLNLELPCRAWRSRHADKRY